jgi:hypothetical protein
VKLRDESNDVVGNELPLPLFVKLNSGWLGVATDRVDPDIDCDALTVRECMPDRDDDAFMDSVIDVLFVELTDPGIDREVLHIGECVADFDGVEVKNSHTHPVTS